MLKTFTQLNFNLLKHNSRKFQYILNFSNGITKKIALRTILVIIEDADNLALISDVFQQVKHHFDKIEG